MIDDPLGAQLAHDGARDQGLAGSGPAGDPDQDVVVALLMMFARR